MWFVPPPLENPLKDKQEDREDGGGGGESQHRVRKSSRPRQRGTALQRPSVRTEGTGPWTYDTGDKDGTMCQTWVGDFKDNLARQVKISPIC